MGVGLAELIADVVDATGEVVDATGEVVDATGEVVDATGEVVDATGLVVETGDGVLLELGKHNGPLGIPPALRQIMHEHSSHGSTTSPVLSSM